MHWSKVTVVAEWQQGLCATYALAMLSMFPHLRMGVLEDDGVEQHFFGHDDEYAYDSLGRHPLPYVGVNTEPMIQHLDKDPSWYFGNGKGRMFYPYGDNGDEDDFERAKALIPDQHPWLA